MDNPFFMSLHQSLTQCVGASAGGGVAVGLFVVGALGGVTHCAGMCGPFVLAQVAARLEALPVQRMREWHRLSGAALIPYHLGRATTYAGLGAVGALMAGKISQFVGLKWLSAVLLVGAALCMASMAVPYARRFLSGRGASGWWPDRVGALASPLFAAPLGWRGYALGVLLGFIPCGLLYGALAAAAAQANPLGGALAMLAFSAGTVPGLIVVGVAGHLAGNRWKAMTARVAPILLLVNAGVLASLAWRSLA